MNFLSRAVPQFRTPTALAHLLAATLGWTASACGSATLQQFVEAQPSGYAAQCQVDSAAHATAVRELAYRPPLLMAVEPSAALPANADNLLTEAQLMQALERGAVHTLLVQARGGLGKSELVKALRGNLCSAKPVFAVDLKDLAAADQPQAAMLEAIASKAAATGERRAQLEPLLASAPWLLIVDSLDEVPPDRRGPALQAVQAMRQRFDKMQTVLMGRPSIFDKYYGLQGLDAVVELRPLDCETARASLQRRATSSEEAKKIEQFVRTWRLDRQSDRGQCIHPFMATYRDLEKIQRTAATFDVNKDRGGQPHSLTEIHEAILSERIAKELAELKLSASEAFAAVDKMLLRDGYVDGEWNLTFSVQRCIDAEGGDAARARHLCEELFQSALFERIGGHKGSVQGAEWQFSPQALADLFVARWIDAQIAKDGTCKAIETQANMLAGKEVAGYLAGRKGGAQCLATLVSSGCAAGMPPEALASQLSRGLPADPALRNAAVQAAKSATAGKASACVDGILGKL